MLIVFFLNLSKPIRSHHAVLVSCIRRCNENVHGNVRFFLKAKSHQQMDVDRLILVLCETLTDWKIVLYLYKNNKTFPSSFKGLKNLVTITIAMYMCTRKIFFRWPSISGNEIFAQHRCRFTAWENISAAIDRTHLPVYNYSHKPHYKKTLAMGRVNSDHRKKPLS